MKRPKWAKLRRYKVVQVTDSASGIRSYKSVMSLSIRAKGCSGKGKGTILIYHPGTIQISPNGLCLNREHTCGRGIHAWRTRAIARDHAWSSSAIFPVWAARWVGTGKKQRAYRVWVGQVSCNGA